MPCGAHDGTFKNGIRSTARDGIERATTHVFRLGPVLKPAVIHVNEALHIGPGNRVVIANELLVHELVLNRNEKAEPAFM
jgi:hypothetical protein